MLYLVFGIQQYGDQLQNLQPQILSAESFYSLFYIGTFIQLKVSLLASNLYYIQQTRCAQLKTNDT